MNTVAEIQEEILKKVESDMPELTSDSKYAIYRLWAYVVAQVIFLFKKDIDHDKKELEEYTNQNKYGRIHWYVKLVYAFKLGYAWRFNETTGDLDYLKYKDYPEGTDLNPIKRVSVTEVIEDKSLVVKVATEDSNGNLVKVSDDVLLQLKNYLEDSKVAGTNIAVRSLNADLIIIAADIYYDGIYSLEDVKANISTALDQYRKEFDFSGKILKNDILETIRSVQGVDDVVIGSIKGKQGEIETAFTRDYLVQSGYFNYSDVALSGNNIVESFNYHLS